MQMECSIREGLSEADMQSVLDCATHIGSAMNAEVERIDALPERRPLPEEDKYRFYIQYVESMASVNIACLLYKYPQVGFTSSSGCR